MLGDEGIQPFLDIRLRFIGPCHGNESLRQAVDTCRILHHHIGKRHHGFPVLPEQLRDGAKVFGEQFSGSGIAALFRDILNAPGLVESNVYERAREQVRNLSCPIRQQFSLFRGCSGPTPPNAGNAPRPEYNSMRSKSCKCP